MKAFDFKASIPLLFKVVGSYCLLWSKQEGDDDDDGDNDDDLIDNSIESQHKIGRKSVKSKKSRSSKSGGERMKDEKAHLHNVVSKCDKQKVT